LQAAARLKIDACSLTSMCLREALIARRKKHRAAERLQAALHRHFVQARKPVRFTWLGKQRRETAGEADDKVPVKRT